MLEHISVRNYRGCVATEFAPQPDLSVLIGPNGSGKTTILSSLMLLRRLTEISNHPSFDEEPDEVRLKATFRDKSNRKAILTADLLVLTDEHNTDRVVGSNQSWYARDYTGSQKRINTPLEAWHYLPPPRGHGPALDPELWFGRIDVPNLTHPDFVSEFSEIARFALGFRYYSVSQFTGSSECPVSFEVEKRRTVRRTLTNRGHMRFLNDLYQASLNEKQSNYGEFLATIGPQGIGLVDELSFKEIQTSSIDYTVRKANSVKQRNVEKLLVIPQFRVGSNVLSPSQLSEGTFKAITLLFYVITDRSSLLLIEEPEVCVHHGLLNSIVEVIKQYAANKQIIVSTHSDLLLDRIEPRNVYTVTSTIDEGITVAQIEKTMSASDYSALRGYLETDGNLGEYWRETGFQEEYHDRGGSGRRQ